MSLNSVARQMGLICINRNLRVDELLGLLIIAALLRLRRCRHPPFSNSCPSPPPVSSPPLTPGLFPHSTAASSVRTFTVLDILLRRRPREAHQGQDGVGGYERRTRQRDMAATSGEPGGGKALALGDALLRPARSS